jgi:hypothetical protein
MLSGASEAGKLPYEVYKISGALSLLSEARHDSDVKVRAVLSYSPEPNELQREEFARAYLAADRPEDALAWLQGSWGRIEDTRQSLLADALHRLGRSDESAPIRQRLFERSLSVFDFQRWLEHVPEAAQTEARSHARRLANQYDDPTRAAILLMELDDAETAEVRLIAEPARLDGGNYFELVPLAKALRAHGCTRGETVVYRALLRSILDRAYARAYGHAAEYWSRLQEIAHAGVGLVALQSHESFEAEIRSRHGRKVAFWAHVNVGRATRADDDLGD